jgi:hypothetical protein
MNTYKLGKEITKAGFDAETERLFSIPALRKKPKYALLYRMRNMNNSRDKDHRSIQRKISPETAERFHKWVKQVGGNYEIRLN